MTTQTQPSRIENFSREFRKASDMLKTVISFAESAIDLSRKGHFPTALEYLSSAIKEEEESLIGNRYYIFKETAQDVIYRAMASMCKNYDSSNGGSE
jgi:hypothetical protein